MKNRFSIFSKLLAQTVVFIVGSILLSACSGGGGGGGGGGGVAEMDILQPVVIREAIEPQEEVIVLTAPLVAMLDETSIAAITTNGAEGELRFIGGAAMTNVITVSAVIVVTPRPNVPDGLYRVVLSVRTEGNDLIVMTRQAGLLDIIKNGDFEVRGTFTSSADALGQSPSALSAQGIFPLQTVGGVLSGHCNDQDVAESFTRSPVVGCVGGRIRFTERMVIRNG